MHHNQHTKNMKDMETTEETAIIKAEEVLAPNVKEIGEVVVVDMHALI